MDYDEGHRVAVIRSINSTDMKDPIQKEVARVPPIPPPKPKITTKNCQETNKNAETKIMSEVRQAILRGSKNPTGSSYGESSAFPQNHAGVKHQVAEFPRIQINSLTSRCSIISNEERDANLDIIFSDWGSQAVAQKLSNLLPEQDECPRFEPSNKAYRNSLDEPLSSMRCQDSKLDYKVIARETNDQRLHKNEPRSSPLREKKQEDDAKDSEYLLPRLEKQSNQILVLAENNPTELKNDIVRNCDVIEDQVPESGHTGNLLKYWKNVESSPENECKEIISARHDDSSSYSDEEKVTHEKVCRDKEQEKSTSDELTHEQVLNDILQEFESFNKDILDLKIDVGREPAREGTRELQNQDYSDETQYVMSKYDFLATSTTKETNKDTTPSADPPTQEEGVYYELDAGEGLIDDLTKLGVPAQESNSKDEPGNKVTLIAFRKLNKEESEVSSKSSPSVSYIEGTNNSILKIEEATSHDEEKAVKKKSSSKQKCLVM